MTVLTGSHWQAGEVDWDCIDTHTAAAAAAEDDDDDHTRHVVASRIKEGTRKRLYEHGEGELDREIDKMYKRDYWADPAYAPLLELSGLLLARAEAIDCFSDRVLRATDAMLAQRWQEWEERRSRGRAADESEPARAAAAGEGRRLFFCFWRSVVDNLAALLRYFLG